MSESNINDSEIQKLLQRIRETILTRRSTSIEENRNIMRKFLLHFTERYAEKIDAEYFDIQTAQKEMLEQVKAYTDFTDETDMLTELQHYGGKTNLIDFTTDYLTALFFACDSSSNEDKAGRIIILNKKSNQGIISSPKKNQNNRVISQKSKFFQSPKGYLDEKDSAVEIISIPKEMKQPVLDYLRKYHGITTHTIYSDIFGYIQNQEKHQPAYAEFYIGLTSYKSRANTKKRSSIMTEAIRHQPARCQQPTTTEEPPKRELGRHEEAIADYAMKQFASIRNMPIPYNNRGTAKHALGLTP